MTKAISSKYMIKTRTKDLESKINSPQRHVVKAFAVYMAASVLGIALCKSVLQDGVYINI